MTQVNFLVPRTLTWDKLCALYVYVQHNFGLVAKFSDLVSGEQPRAAVYFDDENGVPQDAVDVDVRRKYHGRAGSATEVAVQQTGLALAGVNVLIDLLRQNNQTGYLKSSPQSLVFLIRELYNVGAENPSKKRRIQVIDQMWPALFIYFAAAEKGLVEKELPNPFTLDALHRLATGANAYNPKHFNRWDEAFQRVDREREGARSRASVLEPAQVFDVRIEGREGNKAEGHVLPESDNTRLVSEYIKNNPKASSAVVFVVRRSSGNVAIFCRGNQDFQALYEALVAADGADRWFLDTRAPSPMLLNGSTSRDAVPTKLKMEQIVDLIQTYHRHRPMQRDKKSRR